MLGFLFRGLTAAPHKGAALFDRLTAEARRREWYAEGQVPDTLDGRFAVLATVTALALVRIEREGEAGNPASVALTERFIEVMESEHRELGLGDPTLGKTVRKLVGMLARRTASWRAVTAGEMSWDHGVGEALPVTDNDPVALGHRVRLVEAWWRKLEGASLADLEQGKLA